MKKNVNILGVNIYDSSYEDIISYIISKINSRERFSFHNVNVNIALVYSRNDVFRKNLNSFSSLFSDGTGVYWASKILYGKRGLNYRITGSDLYYYILNLANENKLKCFFFGGSREAANQLPIVLRDKFPNINISGIIDRETNFKKDTFERIKNSQADIIFVGLGTPYQEEWIANYGCLLDIPVQIAIGSGLEFISEVKKRAPVILRKLGLEWLYRIYLEPQRLWRRYIFGIPIFMFKIILFKIKLLANKQKD